MSSSLENESGPEQRRSGNSVRVGQTMSTTASSAARVPWPANVESPRSVPPVASSQPLPASVTANRSIRAALWRWQERPGLYKSKDAQSWLQLLTAESE